MTHLGISCITLLGIVLNNIKFYSKVQIALLGETKMEVTHMSAINMNKAKFEQFMHEEKTVLVDYWAPWCVYCRRIAPAYEKIAEEYGDQLVIGKVNIDEEPQLAEAEKIEVIPTLVLYRGGKAVDSIVAPDSKAAIERFIKDAMERA